ncbi:MAG TPA: hypothetical protein VFV19_14765 [Candidatus Polarisedimenticolaceae bacterium]|nr:hypothetical protein [Candidatus Polarisedimenticolaceae bacterium]
MRSKGTLILVAALLVLALQACADTTELTSAPPAGGSAPLKASAMPPPTSTTDAR